MHKITLGLLLVGTGLVACQNDIDIFIADTGNEDGSDSDTGTTDGVDPFCGDGYVDVGEACDDANLIETDACSAACTLSFCGDAIIHEGVEACDDGNLDDGDGCSASCTLEACGDGILQGSEECDDGNLDDADGCSAFCLLETCGDGIVQGSEGCDDGNLDDNDGCSATCAIEECTDGIVQISEECDDGNAVLEDACVNCQFAVCGDGWVYEGVEDCDDGANGILSDACTDECTFTPCGDGFVNNDEQCDDGNLDSDDSCSSTCQIEFRYVFVTSTVYTGNFGPGGVDTAAIRCNQRAAAAGLPGEYRAWLAGGGSKNPSDSFTQSPAPYVKVDGVVVADDWADLIDGTLDNPIDLTELGGPPPQGTATCTAGSKAVWTGTITNGTDGDGGNTCGEWHANEGTARMGRATATDASWTHAVCVNGYANCGSTAPIYCFQQ